MPKAAPVELEGSRKYARGHAEPSQGEHPESWIRRLSNWRDEQVARYALKSADDPGLVLDLPCGTGRFWPLLAEQPNRVILAADSSAHRLAVARASQPADVVARVTAFEASASAIDLGANSVDCIFCLRLLPHLLSAENRQVILKEFHRVTRDTVILSLWVDGNYMAWKRRCQQQRCEEEARMGPKRTRSVVSRADIELEFHQAGFNLLGYKDFLPGYAMSRTYILRKL